MLRGGLKEKVADEVDLIMHLPVPIDFHMVSLEGWQAGIANIAQI